ncbi:MarC family protein [Thermodesulforhabdus norvegica]|uniref:UPF0056 membrane protein n=1 Tax=Thermodesulforhabdus norvegica TaxID=39841 RepID=A0A1I4T7S4_9BACT|nr:MarC family protein [Thermodesulforhabdus norvegica]SFM72610.1 multiple antibiotic resistance protein [Thermodesulforhabdus norvegica]
MMDFRESLTYFFTTFISLFIIMDPIGNLPFFLMFTENYSREDQIKTAVTASLSAGIILLVFIIGGDAVLNFFHVSIPAFQIAGGFIFFLYALQMLHILPSSIKTSSKEEEDSLGKTHVALVPIGTPLLAGPGAITAVLVWRHSYGDAIYGWLLVLAVLLVCVITTVTFVFGNVLRKLLGLSGIGVISRIMGLLLAVLAVQFMVNGFLALQ